MNKTTLIALAALACVSNSQAAIIYQMLPNTTNGQWDYNNDASVSTFTNEFDNGAFNGGGNRYFYGSAGADAVRDAYSEGFSLSSGTHQYNLSTLSWGGYVWTNPSPSTTGDHIDIEAIINGVSLGVQSTPSATNFGMTLTWDASAITNASDLDVSFIITEVAGIGGNGDVINLEIVGGRNGITLEGEALAVPEPSSSALISLASLGLLLRRRR
ncbi:hypothetical protein Rhal01_02245 [Rubritalea halochordaticola]|uniref:Ice-binding protein C-terminal domain-containing protein n=1 Tax=Rubritalea halochordaticola TaxID=714537 RepID=A0ABP9V039_9BACT